MVGKRQGATWRVVGGLVAMVMLLPMLTACGPQAAAAIGQLALGSYLVVGLLAGIAVLIGTMFR